MGFSCIADNLLYPQTPDSDDEHKQEKCNHGCKVQLDWVVESYNREGIITVKHMVHDNTKHLPVMQRDQ